MRSLLIVIQFIMLAGLSTVQAEAPDIEWSQTAGTPGVEMCQDIVETADHNFIAVGYFVGSAPSEYDAYIALLDSDGDVVWQHTLGEVDSVECLRSINLTSDGGAIAAGYKNMNHWLVKFDAYGNVEWEESYDWGGNANYGDDACQLNDGSYLVVGDCYHWSTARNEYDWDMTIFKVDSNGVQQDSLMIEIGYTQHLHAVRAADDGGAFAVGGGTIVMKLTADLEVTWRRGYGGTGSGYAVEALDDGGCMAFGWRDFSYPWDDDMWLLRLEADGDTLWAHQYRDTSNNIGYDLDQCEDGGFILCGYRYRTPGPQDVYVIRTDANGDTLWTKSFGGESWDQAFAVRRTHDGGYVLGGSTQSYGVGDHDFYIVKLYPDDVTAVEDQQPYLPTAFSLKGNYPNPFNEGTVIEYSLKRRSDVTIEIFDLLGRTVRRIEAGSVAAGDHRAEWDGRDESGKTLASGIYLYRLSAEGMSQSRKMVMVK